MAGKRVPTVADKVREITKPIDDEAAMRQRLRDALLDAFRVTAAGVDVTRWQPALPPELRRGKK